MWTWQHWRQGCCSRGQPTLAPLRLLLLLVVVLFLLLVLRVPLRTACLQQHQQQQQGVGAVLLSATQLGQLLRQLERQMLLLLL
jgi:hypothetical protein